MSVEKANEINIKVLVQAMNTQAKENRELKAKVQVLEGSVAALAADIANTKQLMGHLMGRGMGSTAG